MTRLSLGLWVLCWFLLPASLSAQEKGVLDVTEYRFEDERLVGDLEYPQGAVVTANPRGQERSLIRLRQHFVGELLKSLEAL